MKICPRCQKTYPDDNLNFCLEDGSVLSPMVAQPPQTVQVSQPMPTQPQPAVQPTAPPAWNVQPQQPQAYSMQPPKKSSKTWIWVLLILGLVVIVCGGGFAGFIYWAANLPEVAANGNTSTNNSGSTTNKGNFSTTNSSTSNSSTSTSSSSSSERTHLESLDLSKWVPDSSSYADVEFTDGELLVRNKEKKYYYVLAGTESEKSVDADSIVTVRNVVNFDTNLGYGIVFHSKPTPLQQGYAFVIDAKKQRYRVVHHTPQNEDAVINWTRSDAILAGTQSNTLEVRDKPDKIELYINGKMVNSIKNEYGYPNGVIGVYSSGALQVAFKDLGIRR